MSYRTIIPIDDRAEGIFSSDNMPVTESLNGVSLRIDVLPFTDLNYPFNSNSLQIKMRILYSWDNGETFPESTETIGSGNTSGWWGDAKGDGQLVLRSGKPFVSSLGGDPNIYKAEIEVLSPIISCGFSTEEY